MPDRAFRILVVSDGVDPDGGQTDAVAAQARVAGHDVQWVSDHREALALLDHEDVDLVLLDATDGGESAITPVSLLRNRAPLVPIIVLAPSVDEMTTSRLLRAGAEDCLVNTDGFAHSLARAIHHAIDRSRYQAANPAARGLDARDAEFSTLRTLCGPLPLPVTGRSFGDRPFPERAREVYGTLVDGYGALLDGALERRRSGDSAPFEERVDRLVDKLGAYNAGPRDIIELHKLAIEKRVPGASSQRARAYIEEGRLLLLQVMGQLVSFYRALSWGRLPTARPRAERAGSDTKPT